MTINRVWAMPSADTFDIPAIRQVVRRLIAESSISVDPFARNKDWATFRNAGGRVTISEILADARESLSRLTVNGLCSRNHAEKLVREDALAILDRAIVGIRVTTGGDCPYLQTNGTTHWCALANEQIDSEKESHQ